MIHASYVVLWYYAVLILFSGAGTAIWRRTAVRHSTRCLSVVFSFAHLTYLTAVWSPSPPQITAWKRYSRWLSAYTLQPAASRLRFMHGARVVTLLLLLMYLV